MNTTAINNAKIILPDQILEQHSLILEDGKIADIIAGDVQDAANSINADGMYLAPGFIDMHIHGTGNFLIDNGPDDLANLCKLLPTYGVTSFLPTVCPSPKGKDSALLSSLASVSSQGSNILGFHLEGPFLTFTGALPPEALGDADPDRVRKLIEAAKPYPAIFSISPDFKGIVDLIKIMSADSTPVFVTHTQANVKQSQAAIKAGALHATHFYDVFYAPSETEPGARPAGLVEVFLADPQTSVDFILDGEHVDPVVVKMALECKGPDRVCLITDANIGAGLDPGRYKFGKTNVEFKYKGGPARLTEDSDYPGALAGSGLTMDTAVRNAIDLLNLDIPSAIRLASSNPAKTLKIGNSKGQIAKGYDADLILLDDSLHVKQTLVSGKTVFCDKA